MISSLLLTNTHTQLCSSNNKPKHSILYNFTSLSVPALLYSSLSVFVSILSIQTATVHIISTPMECETEGDRQGAREGREEDEEVERRREAGGRGNTGPYMRSV